MQTGLLQLGFDAAIGEFRAQVGILQFVAPGLVQHRMISMQGSTNGKALVAGRGLNPGSAEWSSGKKFSVRDAVQGAAAGQRVSACGEPLDHDDQRRAR